jgi:hypothetical protein
VPAVRVVLGMRVPARMAVLVGPCQGGRGGKGRTAEDGEREQDA